MASEFSTEFFSANRIVKADLRAARTPREEDLERIKKEHDLVTYHEILAYSKGEPVDRSNPRSQRARRHPVLRGVILTLVSAIVGALAGYFVYKFGIFG